MKDHFKDISLSTLQEICDSYLTDFEYDLVYLILHGRRNKEISLILDIPESEVVRLKRNIIRKIKTVYKYHFKLNYLDFFRFATNVLNDKQMQYLVRYYRDLKRLREIAEEFNTQTSNIHRALRTAQHKLASSVDENSPLREFFGCFKDLPYLNIKEIRRNRADDKQLESVQVGKNTLGQWERKGSSPNPRGNPKPLNGHAQRKERNNTPKPVVRRKNKVGSRPKVG